MTLAEWLTEKRMSHAELAVQIASDRSSVSKYVAGTRMPRREVLARIHEVTDGQVTANDFVAAPGGATPDQSVAG